MLDQTELLLEQPAFSEPPLYSSEIPSLALGLTKSLISHVLTDDVLCERHVIFKCQNCWLNNQRSGHFCKLRNKI